jgi:RND family efflux transporter MFP subunit
MKTRTYQIALGAAVVVCVALASVLGYILIRTRRAAPEAAGQDTVLARGPAATPAPAEGKAATNLDTGPSLAPLQLSPQRMQEIGVTTATVEFKNINDDLRVPGNVDIDEQKLSYVQTRFPGWIQNVFANATYQYVRKGQPLFTVYSPDLVSSQQEYLLARKNQKTVSQDGHNLAAQESGWLVQASEERLRQFGIPDRALSELEKSGTVERNITIESPVSGFITERNALPNAYVQPETKLYTIADLSTVWVYANVFQNDLGRLKPGDSARVTVDAYPGQQFHGRIDQILPQVDPATRTARVRLVFANPGVTLKPGMYVNVQIAMPLGRQLVVPPTAVLQSGERAVAFVDHGQGSLEPRTVVVGPQVADSVVILSGLKAGERVVSSANFLVDSEAQLQSAFQNFAPPAAQQPATGAVTPAEQIQIDLSTSPSPPNKGADALRIKLTGPDGKPATGLQVTVTLFMPAMPAMGMAAQHASSALMEKGNGSYEGSVQLSSGGTWQTTITVRRGGQVVATKQMSLDVAGGMS